MDEPKEEKRTKENLRDYLESLKLDGEVPDLNKFSISFSVDESGIVDVGIDWPESDGDETVYMTATLLFSINSGLLKNLMLEAISESAQKYPEIKASIHKAVQNWVDMENSSSGGPCINPTDTLKNI